MNASMTRREFFKASAVAGAAVAAGSASAAPVGHAKSCIFLMLTGGPSQLDTWDPKPDAPSDVRGPFAPIRTAVPGMHVSELFPKMAAMAEMFSLIRTMHHEYAPIHENGFQLLNTGRRFGAGEWPGVGAVVSRLTGENSRNISWWVLPHDRLDTGVSISHGQQSGHLEIPEFSRSCLHDLPEADTERHPFSIMTQVAGAAVWQGSRFVTVNAYPTVFDAISWDCHADKGSLRTTFADYRDTVAPDFDEAYTSLLTDLELKGLLDETLVVAVGEFGRTPKLNCHGGRDHWANCWTAIVAGGGTRGGRIIGASDAIAGEPKERPVHCSELVATIYHAMGVSPATTIPGPDGAPMRVVEAEPVMELF